MNSKGKAGKRQGPSGRRAGSGRAGPGADGLGAVCAVLLSRPRSAAAPDVAAPSPTRRSRSALPAPEPLWRSLEPWAPVCEVGGALP